MVNFMSCAFYHHKQIHLCAHTMLMDPLLCARNCALHLGHGSKGGQCACYPPAVPGREKRQPTVLDPGQPWMWVVGVQRRRNGLLLWVGRTREMCYKRQSRRELLKEEEDVPGES